MINNRKISERTLYNFLSGKSDKTGIGIEIFKSLCSPQDRIMLKRIIERTKLRVKYEILKHKKPSDKGK